MKVSVIADPREICSKKGFFEYFFNILSSVRERGIDIELGFDEGSSSGYIIALGQVGASESALRIELEDDYTLVAKELFGFLGGLLLGEHEQHTVKMFGYIEDAEARLARIERAYSGKVIVFLYKEGLVTTLKVLCEKNCPAVSDIFSEFNRNIYAEEDVRLDARLLELLSVRNKTLCVAESLTGGMICSTIIDNPGASKVFDEGLITYSNSSKTDRLGVDPEVIRNYGAVSYQAAYEMAAGLIMKGNCDIAIATTGIAGPEGGSLSKPVGLTFIAVGTGEKIHVFRHVFKGDRQQIRLAASQAAMFYAIKRLKDFSLDYEEIRIN
ncbi:MAG: CinA family protein [Clostridiales bacterium]|nr:CinA family protein [Clostridiales bacterium]